MKLTLFIGFLLSVFGAQAASDHKDPIARLMKVSHFSFGGVGFAGATSDGETAYNEIMARPTAAADFEKLFQAGNSQAKAYALAALFQVNPSKFTELSELFCKQTAQVSTMTGCIVSHSAPSAIVDQIASGIFSKKK